MFIVRLMIEQYVFIWNVPSTLTWRDLHGLIHTKVIKVEEMAMHEHEDPKIASKVAILRVFSTTENAILERLINEMEMSNGERIRASVESSLYVFFITHYSVHTPNFIRQNLRDVSMTVDESKDVIRCQFGAYGEFMRAFNSVEAMMANNVKMKLYRYTAGGNKLPPPSILSLKFNSVPLREDDYSDSDLVPYNPPSVKESNARVMEQAYEMWNAFHSVKYPSIPQPINPFDNEGFHGRPSYMGH